MQNKINYNGLTIEVKEVIPEMAKDILENHNNLNRHRNKAHVKALLNNMKQGTWRFNGDTIRFDKDGELIDGQHRLAALVEFGQPLTMIVISGFDKETMRTIDQEIKPRNLGDLFKIDGRNNATNIASIISRYFVLSFSKTASFLRTNHSSGRNAFAGDQLKMFTIDDKYNEYYRAPDFYQDLYTYSARCYKKNKIISNIRSGFSVCLSLFQTSPFK